jgi:hypothetical protein
LLLAELTGLAGHGSAQSTHYLTVSHTSGSQITELEASNILYEASLLLRMRDDPSDVAAPVTLCLENAKVASKILGCEPKSNSTGAALPPIISTDGPNLLATEEDFRKIAATPGYVKVVKDISFCGDQKPVGPGTIGGCFISAAHSFAVVRQVRPPAIQLKLEGVLWAHEYGHSKGLPHRDVPLALMNPWVAIPNRILTREECAAIMAPHLGQAPRARSVSLPYRCH